MQYYIKVEKGNSISRADVCKPFRECPSPAMPVCSSAVPHCFLHAEMQVRLTATTNNPNEADNVLQLTSETYHIKQLQLKKFAIDNQL